MKITRITLMIILLILLYLPFIAMASSHGHGRHHGTTGAAARGHQDHQPNDGHVDGHAGYYGTGVAAKVHQGTGTIESVKVPENTVRLDHEPIE